MLHDSIAGLYLAISVKLSFCCSCIIYVVAIVGVNDAVVPAVSVATVAVVNAAAVVSNAAVAVINVAAKCCCSCYTIYAAAVAVINVAAVTLMNKGLDG